MATEKNIQVINALYSAFSTGDMPTVMGFMHPKMEWNEAESNSLADGNPYIGPEAVLNGVFARIGDLYKDFSIAEVKVHGMNDNQVLATLRYVITSKSGKNYKVQAAHHYTLNADGKIVQFQQYVDTKKLAAAEAE